MLTIHTFGPAWGCLDASPFCMKMLAYLRLAGIEHQRRMKMDDIRSAPKGKMPYITLDGEVTGDSELIIARLKALHGDRLNGGLSPAQRAVAHAAARMVEERTVGAMAYARWLDDANWEQHTRPTLFGSLSQPMRTVLPAIVRRQLRKALQAHGIGRHTPAEIDAFGIADLEALAHLLGASPFFFGDTPTELDTTVYGLLGAMIDTPFETPFYTFAREHDTLAPHYQRMDALVRRDGE